MTASYSCIKCRRIAHIMKYD